MFGDVYVRIKIVSNFWEHIFNEEITDEPCRALPCTACKSAPRPCRASEDSTATALISTPAKASSTIWTCFLWNTWDMCIWVVFNTWVSAVSPKVKSDCQKPLRFPESKRFPSLTPICRNLLILFSAPEPCEQNKEYRLTESAVHEMKTLHRWCFEIATRSFPSKSVDNSELNSTTDLHPLKLKRIDFPKQLFS